MRVSTALGFSRATSIVSGSYGRMMPLGFDYPYKPQTSPYCSLQEHLLPMYWWCRAGMEWALRQFQSQTARGYLVGSGAGLWGLP